MWLGIRVGCGGDFYYDADVPDAEARDSDVARPELSAELAFADELVDAPCDPGLGFGDASRTINGVRGTGNGMGRYGCLFVGRSRRGRRAPDASLAGASGYQRSRGGFCGF